MIRRPVSVGITFKRLAKYFQVTTPRAGEFPAKIVSESSRKECSQQSPALNDNARTLARVIVSEKLPTLVKHAYAYMYVSAVSANRSTPRAPDRCGHHAFSEV